MVNYLMPMDNSIARSSQESELQQLPTVYCRPKSNHAIHDPVFMLVYAIYFPPKGSMEPSQMAVPFATAAILNSSVDNDKDGVKAVPAGFAITLPHC